MSIPKIWVAPAHSFDWVTLEALRQETDIRLVSDGIALNSYRKNGFDFIPQQLWNVEKTLLWNMDNMHPS